jgi:putative membrane protein
MDFTQVLVSLAVYAIVIFVGAYIIPGITVKSSMTALSIAVALAVLNILLSGVMTWLVTLVAWPVIILTFGIFTFFIPIIVNAFFLKLIEYVLDEFEMDGVIQPFLMALLIGATFYALDRFYL